MKPLDKIAIIYEVERLVDSGDIYDGEPIHNERRNKWWAHSVSNPNFRIILCDDCEGGMGVDWFRINKLPELMTPKL